MVSEKFRRQLHQQAELWQQEGLIDGQQYEQLSVRYQFEDLEIGAGKRFIAILLGVGSILLALAAITFVAANWQEWSHGFKLTLLLSLLVLVNCLGFSLWRNSNKFGRQKRLGQGLLLLGTLLVGPCMAQIAQMFHLGGAPYGLLFCWGIAVLVMAYSLELTFLGVVAFGLVAVGYSWGQPEIAFSEPTSWSYWLLRHMPLASLLLFAPLAYRCRSQVLFGLEALLLVAALEVNLVQASELAPGVLAAISPMFPAALLWPYDDRIWPGVRRKAFQSLARILALICFCIPVYYLTFYDAWDFSVLNDAPSSSAWPTWDLLVDVAAFLGLTIVLWLRLIFRPRNLDLGTITVGSMLAISTVVLLWHHNLAPIPILATFLFNCLFFLLALGLLRSSLETLNRNAFWSGILLLTLQIISRLLEYDTDLLFKSFIFFLCGAGVIAAGLWFEKHLSTQISTQENLP